MDGLDTQPSAVASYFDSDNTNMFDYDYTLNPLSTSTITTIPDDSSPEAHFLPSNSANNHFPQQPSFTPARGSGNGTSFLTGQTSPLDRALTPPFLVGLNSLTNSSPPEQGFAGGVDGDSPELDMRGLRINSRLPSPVSQTVCPEDVMMISADFGMEAVREPRKLGGSLFESPVRVRSMPSAPASNGTYVLLFAHPPIL
jgi:hypothetical protein